MSLINYITKKIINLDNNIFSFNYDNSDNIDPLIKILFSSLVNNSYKSKFNMFRETINSFLLFSREEFINYFCKIQKIYYSLSRFAFLYKYKKSILSVSTDMGLNEININNPNIICIYHINTKYLFNVCDLIKIINTSLTNAYMFFSEPLPCKNPYNNLPFTKSILYNIYFFIKFNTNIYDDLFFKFFHCDFNMTIFFKKYEHILREYSILNFIKNSTVSALYEEINRMINIYNYKNYKNKIIIANEFPKNVLIKIMKPYLLLFLQSYYTLIPSIKRNADFELNYKLKKFQKFNPQFGRKIIKIGIKINSDLQKKSFIKSYEFNNKHIAFNCNNNINYLTNHLQFSEVNDYEIYANDNHIDMFRINISSMATGVSRPVGYIVQDENDSFNNANNNDEINDHDNKSDSSDSDDENDSSVYANNYINNYNNNYSYNIINDTNDTNDTNDSSSSSSISDSDDETQNNINCESSDNDYSEIDSIS
jgi:hypothetical protein